MKYRTFGRTGWQISEIGFGMWQIGSQWGKTDPEEAMRALRRAVELGCNFFDTAWAYGEGRSEKVLGELVRSLPGKRLYTASKIPPKNRKWPATPESSLDDTFPPDYIREYTEISLKNLGLNSLDLMQFHVWHDSWALDERWQRAMSDLKREGLIRAIGISINRWEPANAIKALRAGVVDAVQVIYNIFDQNPEDELFPVCRELNIAVIARVPFDEGSLTGTLTLDSKWPEDDFRHTYFTMDNLKPTVERVEALRPLAPPGSNMPEMALRFILSCPEVSTIIPGMRKVNHVQANLAASDKGPLPPDLVGKLRPHRWVRQPAWWSA